MFMKTHSRTQGCAPIRAALSLSVAISSRLAMITIGRVRHVRIVQQQHEARVNKMHLPSGELKAGENHVFGTFIRPIAVDGGAWGRGEK